LHSVPQFKAAHIMQSNARKLSVVVISMGRPECLFDITQNLNAQTRTPDRIVFVVTNPADVPSDFGTVTRQPDVIISAPGTCHQRNIGIETLNQTTGIIAFFDDDYLPVPTALQSIEAAFDTFGPTVAGMSGHLIADGINGPGMTNGQASQLIAGHRQPKGYSILKDTIGLYGCNMVFRADAIGQIRFDEDLPLYAWQEDVDFAHRVARASGKRMVLTDAFSGVHRGVKNGREARGIRLGYSQIANTWYLWQNSSLPGRFAARVALRNLVANHMRMRQSEPWIDRRGRARGNRLALCDIILRRADPQRIRTL
jgi:GT2 family glycosyltransferase